MPHTDLVTVPPTESKPIHKLYISARGHYCGKEVPTYFAYNASWKIDNTYHASTLQMHETGICHWSEIYFVVKLLVITLTYHNLIY